MAVQKIREILLAAVILAFPVSASGASISFSDTFDFGSFSVGGSTGHLPRDFPIIPASELPQFDPSLGTLLRVDLSIQLQGQLDVRLQSIVTAPLPYTWGYDVSTLYTGTLGATFTPIKFEQDVSAVGSHTFYASGESIDIGPFIFSLSQTQSITPADLLDFNGFIGTGNRIFYHRLRHDMTTTPDNPGGLLAFWQGLAGTSPNGTVSVTYEYDPVAAVPVPAALPLFVSGLSIMGLLGWRRKRKAHAVA